MTFREAQFSLQIEADARAGFVMRERGRLIRAQQDAAWANVTGAQRGDR